MTKFAVIDFETTCLSPGHGARPTEIAVVIIENGKIIDRYQSLMNANVPIPYEIQLKTGITDEMVRKAPSVGSVMKTASSFVGKLPLVAHNATFDCKFWDMELQSLRQRRKQEFICSLLLARRLFSDAPNHQLETLISFEYQYRIKEGRWPHFVKLSALQPSAPMKGFAMPRASITSP